MSKSVGTANAKKEDEAPKYNCFRDSCIASNIGVPEDIIPIEELPHELKVYYDIDLIKSKTIT